MERYRVQFENNKPLIASKIDWDNGKTLKVRLDGQRKLLEWIIVYGDDENDAIQTAHDVVNETLIKYLG